MRKYISAVEITPSAVLCYGSPSKLIQASTVLLKYTMLLISILMSVALRSTGPFLKHGRMKAR